MEESKFAIDDEATQSVFLKYGGAEKWLERGTESAPLPEEARHYEVLCTAALKMLSQEKLILEDEQQTVYETIGDGLEFGLQILAYNFMHKRELVHNDFYSHALEFTAANAQKYIDRTEEPEDDPNEEDANTAEMESYISGFMQLVDANIDQVCPQIDRQYEFRIGAKLAQEVFKAALSLAEHVERIKTKNEFEALMSFNYQDGRADEL